MSYFLHYTKLTPLITESPVEYSIHSPQFLPINALAIRESVKHSLILIYRFPLKARAIARTILLIIYGKDEIPIDIIKNY